MSAKSNKGMQKQNLGLYNSNPQSLKHQSYNGGPVTNMILDSANPIIVHVEFVQDVLVGNDLGNLVEVTT